MGCSNSSVTAAIRWQILTCVGLLLVGWPSLAQAQTLALSSSVGVGFATPTDDNLGFEFATTTPIVVTELGVSGSMFLGPLSASHEVGIWRVSDGALMVSGTVPAGSAAPLESVLWRMVSVTPVILPAGSYVASAVMSGDRPIVTTPVMSGSLVYVTGRETVPAEPVDLVFPNQPVATTWANANFKFFEILPLGQVHYEYDALDRVTLVTNADGSRTEYTYDPAGNILGRTSVPEPETIPMGLAGLMLLAAFGRRRHRCGERERTRWPRVAAAGIALIALALPATAHAQAGAGPAGRPDWQETVRERIADAEYEVSWSRARLRQAGEALQAPNRAHGFRAHFLDEGIRVTPREETDESWEFGLSFLSYGRGDAAQSAGWGTPRADRKRVEYERGDVLEWFVNDRKGLEQGFTLRAPPRRRSGRRATGAAGLGERRDRGAGGSDPAFVALRVDGDASPMLAADRQSVSFQREGAPLAIAHYDHLVVVDAAGRTLDAWMEVFRDGVGHGIRLVFDDTEAVYPVEIDPLLTTPSWTAVGNQADDGFGFAVSGAGDVNADGYDDVLVGVPWYDGGEQDNGRAYLFLGSPAGLSTAPAWFASGDTAATGVIGALLGFSVASAGDVDNDGFDDVLVSATPNASGPGQVFLYRGGPSGLGLIADWSLLGRTGMRLGVSVAGAGDLNGDGFADIVIGEPGQNIGNVNQGRVYVFYGNTTATLGGGQQCVATSLATFGAACDGAPLAAADGLVWGEAGTDEWYGEVVASAGNVNCDAFDDLVVGQPRFDNRDGGRIDIFLGSSTGVVAGVGAAALTVQATNDVSNNFDLEFGRALVAAGPLDGDPSSCGDILVGAPGKDDDPSNLNRGAVYVIKGGDPFPAVDSVPSAPFAQGTVVRETFGASLANVGDVNGDGAEDFLVGAPGEPNFPETAGRAYLLLGSAGGVGGLSRVPAWRADGAEPNAFLGSAVAGAGDVNNDQLDDLIIGSAYGRVGRSSIPYFSPDLHPTDEPGAAFVYYGTVPGLFGELLGDAVSGEVADSFAWNGFSATDAELAASTYSPGIAAGSVPGSVILSTGLAQDKATGSYDLNGDGLPDRVAGGVLLDMPTDFDAKTLRFTTQYLVADPDEEPRPEAKIQYLYNATDLADSPDLFFLETDIERLGDGEVQTPVSHAIDVSDPGITSIKLQIQVEEQGTGGSGADSAVVLSNVYFSDVPVPDHLSPEPASPECATLGSDPTGPEQDRNGDCRVDYVANPRPTDVSASAGPFRYQVPLFDVPGKIIPFQLSLSYDSERTREEQLGPKWSHSYASTLISTGDVAPVDTCDDTLIAYPGGGSVEIFEGEPNPAYNGSSNLIRCIFPSRYPGVFSSMDTVPAPLPDGRRLLRYRYTDGFRAGYEQVALGSNEYRRRSYIHPDASRNLLWNYDATTGEIESIQDSRGELFFFSYDESFDPPRLVSVNGSGAQVSFGYSALGFLDSVTDANGLETTFTYDDDGKLLTITDADGTRNVANEYETFDGLGLGDSGDRIVRQRNALPGDVGRVTTYNRGDELETQDREDGRKLDRYDVFGRLVETRVLLDSSLPRDLADCDTGDAWCAVSTFEYNAENLVVRQTDPLGIATEFEYDGRGNLICRTLDADGLPNRMGMLYDGINNLLAELVQRDPSDLPACPLPDATVIPEPAKWIATTYTYRPFFNYLLTRTDPEGNTTSYAYDELDGSPEESLLQSIENADQTVRSFDYDSLGNVSSITNELGDVATFTTDLMGRPTSARDPRPETSPGEFTRRTQFDPGGRLTATFDPPLDPLLGFASSPTQVFTYDAQGRELTRRDEIGQVWTRSYTPTGQLEAETDPLGHATGYAYDLENRLTSIVDPRSFETTQSYDAAGRLERVTDPFGEFYSFTYDKAGRLTTETGPQVDPAVPSSTTYMYDGQGRKIIERDALDDPLDPGDWTFFTYDSRGRVLTRTEPSHTSLGARVWSATYTDTGQLESLSTPPADAGLEDVTTTFSYDEMNRVDLETQVQVGRVTDYDYDEAGRLRQVRVGVGPDVLTSVQAIFDAAGNNTAVTDPRDSLKNILEYDYDALNRIVRERDGLGNEVQIAYEERGLVAARTNARGQVVDFGYDHAGRLTETGATDITGSWTITETLDASGNATASTVDTGAAISVQRSFDGLDRQTSRTVALPPASPSVATEYDGAGNVSKVIYSDGKEVSYEYDALSRLVSVTDWAANVTTYAYDEVGNVVGMTRPGGSSVSYAYDRAGRLLSIEDRNDTLADPIVLFQADFELDAAGRRVSATFDLPLEPTLDPGASFVYDDANRLVSRDGDVFSYDQDGNVTSGTIGGSSRSLGYNALNQLVEIDGGAEVIRYDGDGRRASRQVGASTTYYVYDTAGRLIEEVNGSGVVTARYVHGLGLISRHDEGSGATSVYHFDSRGSTLALTDLADGEITDAYAYTPYGDVQRAPGNATPNPFTYNGRDGVVDDANGLYYMQARYYAPELMRFIQQDPVYEGELSRPVSLNRYAYVEGNPIEKIDPTGEFGFISAAVGAVAGAATGAVVAAIEGKDLEDILKSAGEGAAAGAIIGATGGAGLIGAAIGGGVSLAQGGSFSDVALGASIGALSSVSFGAAVGTAFGEGFFSADGSFTDRLKAGGIDAAFAAGVGAVGAAGSKVVSKYGKALLRKRAAKNFLKSAGRPTLAGGRRGAISATRSAVSPALRRAGAILEEGFALGIEEGGTRLGTLAGGSQF